MSEETFGELYHQRRRLIEAQRERRNRIERADSIIEWYYLTVTIVFLFGITLGLIAHRVWG